MKKDKKIGMYFELAFRTEGENKLTCVMRPLVKIAIILLFLFSFLVNSFSQLNGKTDSLKKVKRTYTRIMIRTAPKLTFEFSGFYSYGVFELSANDNGDFAADEFIKGENFGVRHGVGGDFVAKIPLHKRGNLRLNISGSFSKFSSKFNKITVDQVEAGYVSYNVFKAELESKIILRPLTRSKHLPEFT